MRTGTPVTGESAGPSREPVQNGESDTDQSSIYDDNDTTEISDEDDPLAKIAKKKKLVKKKGDTRELVKNFVLKTKHFRKYPWLKPWCTGPPDHNDNRCRFTCRFCGEHRSLKTKLKESLIRHFMLDKHYFVDVRYRVSVNLPIYTQPQNVTDLPRLATQHEAELIKTIAFRNTETNIRFKLRGYKKLYLQDMTPLGDIDPDSVRTTQISLYVRLLRRGVSLNLARELWDSLGSLSGSESFCSYYDWDGPHVMSVLVSMFLTLIRHMATGIMRFGGVSFEQRHTESRTFLFMRSWFNNRHFRLCLGSYPRSSSTISGPLKTIAGMLSTLDNTPSVISLTDFLPGYGNVINCYQQRYGINHCPIELIHCSDEKFLKIIAIPTGTFLGDYDIRYLIRTILMRLGTAQEKKWMLITKVLRHVSFLSLTKDNSQNVRKTTIH